MTTTFRRLIRRSSRFALSLVLVAGAAVATPQTTLGQAKEPTDGFFDVPHREGEPAWGLPAYMVTTAMAGLAVFILCKSARRT